MSRIDSEPKPRITFREGTFKELHDFVRRLQKKGQAEIVPATTVTFYQLFPSSLKVMFACHPISSEIIGAMTYTIHDETVHGKWLICDEEYAILQSGPALIEYAKSLCSRIILEAYPFYLDKREYGKIRDAVAELKKFYINLDFKPVHPNDPNNTEMVWEKSSDEPREA